MAAIAGVGVRADTPPDLRARLAFINVVAAFVLCLCLPFIPAHVFAGSAVRAVLLALEVVLLVLVFVLNDRGWTLAGRWLLLLTMSLSVGAVTATTGSSSLVWVCFVAVAAVSPLAFTSRERLHAFAAMALAVLLGGVNYFGLLNPVAEWIAAPPFPPAGEALIVAGSLVVAPALVYWQARSMDAHAAELDEARAELEIQVGRAAVLARELEERSDQSDEASQAKSRFLAHMSHEIRTPLAAIVSLVDLAKRSAEDAERAEHLQVASQSASHLLRILNDILDLSKVEHGQLELELLPFDLEELVEDVRRLTCVRVNGAVVEIKSTVRVGEARWRLGDPLRLKQVLLNLTSNAVKFTERGSIRIVARAEDERVAFEVHDTGTGMSSEQIARVFEAFQQADSSINRTHGGTGLGLTISRQIVGQMGGRLQVESTLGAGSCFSFSLPLEASVPPVRSPEPVHAPESRDALRLLVAEDNAINARIVRLVLERMGHQVVVVGDGLQAVERAFDGFDVVIMDVQMPHLDGLAATERIRALEVERGLERLPIVALTANAMHGDRARCLAAGMDGYLAKPLDRAAVARVLAERVQRRPGGP